MKIAIIGTGISGLTAAYLLHQEHQLTLFEAGDHVGGHTHTHDISHDGDRQAVDTGFIVFNEWTYPNFIKILDQLGVESQPTSMGFSVKDERNGLEWSGGTLDQLFAQRRNALNPKFLWMIRDILRFNREAPEALHDPRERRMTLGGYLRKHRYSRMFIEDYIVPMGAAIWSAEPEGFLQVPLKFFVQFFKNHGMLSVRDRPIWRVIKGGSKCYVEKMTAPFVGRIRLNTPVQTVKRFEDRAEVTTRGGEPESFDAVIIAAHSDQALRMLADPSVAEREILGAMPYQKNDTVLHTDDRVLPKSKRAWAAWNYHVPKQKRQAVAVTYDMNILQGLRSPHTYCVSLNYSDAIAQDQVLKNLEYHHPVFNRQTTRAQKRHREINGVNRTYYCGAYWRYGFHEDGVMSGLRVASKFGKRL